MKTVLLVEDDPIIARLTIAHLARGGWQVDHAPDGRVAIAALSVGRYGLVVLDLELPEIDGVGVLIWLRAFEAREELTRTPVLIASATYELPASAATLDVDGVLQKPIAMSALDAVLGSKEPRRDDRTH